MPLSQPMNLFTKTKSSLNLIFKKIFLKSVTKLGMFDYYLKLQPLSSLWRVEVGAESAPLLIVA